MGQGLTFKPETPALQQAVQWADPKQDSVFDSELEQAVRWLVRKLGMTDPNAQLMSPMMPAVPSGQATTGPLGHVINAIGQKIRAGMGSLAQTIEPGAAKGSYNLLEPVKDRVNGLYEIGNALPMVSNWEGHTNDELVQAFGGDREAAMRWARMWGATSPNTSVPVNTRESVSALIHTLENPGVPFTEELIKTLPNAKITMAGSKFGNLNAAVEGRVLSPDMKAEAMAGFMTGEPRLPLDVHALHAVGSKSDVFDTEISALRTLMTDAEGLPRRGGLTNPQIYRRYEDALRRALEDIAPGRNINQVFGEMWEGTRSFKGLKWEGGPIDILRKKGLLEMGAMLDPERLKAALRQQGWTAGAIAGLLAALGSEGTVEDEGML